MARYIITPINHMLWVLIESISMRCFQRVSQQMISITNKYNIANCLELAKALISGYSRQAPVLKKISINVSYHILVASLTLMALF